MGYNSTIVVMNDSLHAIEQDPEFGKKLAAAISGLQLPEKYRNRDVSALGHCNAATAIESHHADGTAIVAVGGNYGTLLGHSWGYKHHDDQDKLRILQDLAESMGYRIVKRAKKT